MSVSVMICGLPTVPLSDEQADALVAASGQTFVCHQGMRRVVAWTHPDGHRVDNVEHDYKPPITAYGVPYRADGRPAERCAGWARAAMETTS